jgi:hypothetical protein
MTRGTLSLILLALLLAVPALPAEEPDEVVVVDPADLRKPVPDPEEGLSEKYGDKVVRFSGEIRRASFDKKTKTHRYELHHDILQPVPAKDKTRPAAKGNTKPAMTVAETIVVPVTFLKPQKELQQEFERLAKAKKGVPLTVQGKGSVMSDGTLVISEAVIIPKKPFSSR